MVLKTLFPSHDREVEKRGNKKPGLSDLRESGAIEQDCDACLFIMRPEVYGSENVVVRSNGKEEIFDTTNGALIYSEKFRNDTNFNCWVQFKDGHFNDWPDKSFPEFSPVDFSTSKNDGDDLPF